MSEGDYDTIMDTNVKGVFFVAQAVAARMLEHKLKGRIVNIASIGALKPLPGLVTYSMSKAAVAMLTRTAANRASSGTAGTRKRAGGHCPPHHILQCSRGTRMATPTRTKGQSLRLPLPARAETPAKATRNPGA